MTPTPKAQLADLLASSARRAAAVEAAALAGHGTTDAPSADALFEKHHQAHLLAGYDALPAAGQTKLAAQLTSIFAPPAKAAGGSDGAVEVTNIFHESLRMSADPPHSMTAPDPGADVIDVTSLPRAHVARLTAAGREFIRDRKAAVIVLAGGSGTRLGVSFPKGMLCCPLLMQKRSLFALQAEKIRAAEVAAGAKAGDLPLCLMTSPQTDEGSRKFFADNGFFGLVPSQVHFFCQGTMPCFVPSGRMILAAPDAVAEAPGGNAGIYAALEKSGVLAALATAGVEAWQVVTVDNLLVNLADPVLFGLYAEAGGKTMIAAKTCPKVSDNEAVGVFSRRAYPNLPPGITRWGVCEYTEIGPELAAKRDAATGKRQFDHAHICINLFSTKFLKAAAAAMAGFTYYHVARKPIPTTIPAAFTAADAPMADVSAAIASAAASGGDGRAGVEKVPGVKLEAFIFDLFQLADAERGAGAVTLVSIDRAEEFAAIKNADVAAPGAAAARDSPATAVGMLHAMHGRWLLAAVESAAASGGPGAAAAQEHLAALRAAVCSESPVLGEAYAEETVPVEVSALLASDAAALGQVLARTSVAVSAVAAAVKEARRASRPPRGIVGVLLGAGADGDGGVSVAVVATGGGEEGKRPRL